jgi:glycosyltransferase involved in cell wall biosynthesis
MNILVVSHKYPPSIGGMQTQCFELVQGLKKHHEVHECIYRGKGSNVIFLLTAWWKSMKIMKKVHVDMVYANDGLMAFCLTPLYWFKKPKMAVTIHGLDVVFPLKFYQRWLKKYLSRFAGVIAVSDPTSEELKNRGIVQNQTVIRNGFAPGEKSQMKPVDKKAIADKLGVNISSKKMLVSIGRSVRRKGFSWFIENVLPNLDEEVIYVIIGPTIGDHDKIRRQQKKLPRSLFKTLVLLNGTPMDELRVHELIVEKNLEKRVHHISNLTNEEVNQFLMAADLFVMPNIKVAGDYEGFGLVALEAVMAECLCIASRVDGIPSAIEHEKNGILLPPEDGKQWSSTVNYFLENESERNALASKFRDYTHDHCSSWEDMAAEYVKVFEKIVSSGNETVNKPIEG